MGWSWRCENGAGAVVEPTGLPAEEFPSQADAETWLGEHWRELLAAGVDQVVLLETGRVVYGPMSLHPAD